MLEQVAETISRYNMFERGHTVGVAVSGGADSVCLLHVLLELAPRWALRLRVLHLNHRLRGQESLDDAVFVREMAGRLGLERRRPGNGRRPSARRERREPGTSWPGEVRRQFFRERLEAGLVNRVALGHTRSDQAETVLFRLLRGCGTAGLAGILPVTGEGIVRPLLDVDRAGRRALPPQRNIPWREDSSNRDPAFARNRIRHELLPASDRDWNPSLTDSLAHMATLVQDEERYWDQANRTGCRPGPRPAEARLSCSAPRAFDPWSCRSPDVCCDAPSRIPKVTFWASNSSTSKASWGSPDKLAGEGGIEIPGLELLGRSIGYDWLPRGPRPWIETAASAST